MPAPLIRGSVFAALSDWPLNRAIWIGAGDGEACIFGSNQFIFALVSRPNECFGLALYYCTMYLSTQSLAVLS